MLLVLAFEDITIWTILAMTNIKIIKKSVDTFVINIWSGNIDTIRFPHE